MKKQAEFYCHKRPLGQKRHCMGFEKRRQHPKWSERYWKKFNTEQFREKAERKQ